MPWNTEKKRKEIHTKERGDWRGSASKFGSEAGSRSPLTKEGGGDRV